MAHHFESTADDAARSELPKAQDTGAVAVNVAVGIYLVTAYRWGETNNHWYHVYGGTDRSKAVALARAETADRGGKYAAIVWEFVPDGCDYKRIAYFPSSGEDDATTDPLHNHRLDYFQRLGFFLHEASQGKALLPCPDDPKRLTYQDVSIPDYQRGKVEYEQSILRAMCAHEPPSQKQGEQT